jgi:hypothetical protein
MNASDDVDPYERLHDMTPMNERLHDMTPMKGYMTWPLWGMLLDAIVYHQRPTIFKDTTNI